MIFQNKKADERILSFYWIIIFVLITIAIVSATLFYFSAPLDIRDIEARVLNDKIIDCITEDGSLNLETLDALDPSGGNLEVVCGLNFNDEAYNENQFYIELDVGGERKVTFDKDNSGKFKPLCGEDSGDYPICHENKLFVLDEGGDFVLVRSFSSIGKVNQNVKE